MSLSNTPATQSRKRTASERALTNADPLAANKKARKELEAKKAVCCTCILISYDLHLAPQRKPHPVQLVLVKQKQYLKRLLRLLRCDPTLLILCILLLF